MKNLKVAKKLFITFTIIIILTITLVSVSILSLTSASRNLDTFYKKPFSVTNTTMDMQRAREAAVKYFLMTTTTDDTTEINEYLDSSQQELDVLRTGIEFLYAHFSGDKKLIDTFKATMDSSIDTKKKMFEYAKANENEKAMVVFRDQYQPILTQAMKELKEINTASQGKATSIFEESNSNNIASLILLALISAATICIIIPLAIYLSRSFTKPLKEIDTAAKNLAEGNLDIQIHYTSKDEFGVLAATFREMAQKQQMIIGEISEILGAMADGNFRVNSRIEEQYVGSYQDILMAMRKINRSLNTTLSGINLASNQVSVGADQVSSGAQALSQGATEQASSVEELSATLAELTQKIEETSSNALQASSLSNEAGDGVIMSNQHMQDLISAMNTITKTSNEISKIIKAIDDIAFQTNILALNAAVEAARAGAAGKGFAVVADEVRNLAGKSAEAAKNTTALIENTINAIESGKKIADETADSLELVVAKTTDVNEKVERIAEASNQQASSIAQISTGVEQISSVVQNNSATAEESAAASEELSGQAQMLKDLVGKFKLRDMEDEPEQISAPQNPGFDTPSMVPDCSSKY